LTPLSGCDRGAGLFAFYRGRGVDRRFAGKFAAAESDRVLKERAAYRQPLNASRAVATEIEWRYFDRFNVAQGSIWFPRALTRHARV
jgi:hypothetical protein